MSQTLNLLKDITIDLAHVNAGNVIRIHEGDHNASSFHLAVYNKGVAYPLTGYTVKYDAVINGYLAENDAAADSSGNTITIPITPNMTAMSGKLLVDVKIIDPAPENSDDEDRILFTQTLQAWVEKAIIDESIIIDISGTTIGGKLAALEAKFPVVTADIADGAVTTDKLGGKAVTRAKIDDGAVGTNQLGTGAVTEDNLGSGAVTAAKIAPGVIPTKISQLSNDGIYRRLGYVSDSSSYTPTTYNGVSGAKPDFGVGDVVIMNGVLWRVTAVAEQVGGGWSYTLSSIGLATSKLYNDAGFLTQHQDISGKMDLVDTVTYDQGPDVDSTASVPMGQIFKYNNQRYIKTSSATPVSAQLRIEDAHSKVTSIDANSTNEQYPTAKCVYDLVGNIADAFAAML